MGTAGPLLLSAATATVGRCAAAAVGDVSEIKIHPGREEGRRLAASAREAEREGGAAPSYLLRAPRFLWSIRRFSRFANINVCTLGKAPRHPTTRTNPWPQTLRGPGESLGSEGGGSDGLLHAREREDKEMARRARSVRGGRGTSMGRNVAGNFRECPAPLSGK